MDPPLVHFHVKGAGEFKKEPVDPFDWFGSQLIPKPIPGHATLSNQNDLVTVTMCHEKANGAGMAPMKNAGQSVGCQIEDHDPEQTQQRSAVPELLCHGG